LRPRSLIEKGLYTADPKKDECKLHNLRSRLERGPDVREEGGEGIALIPKTRSKNVLEPQDLTIDVEHFVHQRKRGVVKREGGCSPSRGGFAPWGCTGFSGNFGRPLKNQLLQLLYWEG